MLLRQTILYLPAQVLGPLFQFVAVVAWTHFLSPHELGVFALVAAAQELAYTAVLFWFSLYTMRYYDAQGSVADRTSFLNTESAVLLTASLMTGFGLLALPMIVEGAWSWKLEAATIAYSVTRGAVSQYSDRARAEHDTLSYTVLQIFWPVLGLALGVLFVNVLRGGHCVGSRRICCGASLVADCRILAARFRKSALAGVSRSCQQGVQLRAATGGRRNSDLGRQQRHCDSWSNMTPVPPPSAF